MALIPEGWRRAISPEEAADIQDFLGRLRAESDKGESKRELEDLRLAAEKSKLRREARQARRDEMAEEEFDAQQDMEDYLRERGYSAEVAKRRARLAVGGLKGGDSGFDELLQIMKLRMMEKLAIGEGEGSSPASKFVDKLIENHFEMLKTSQSKPNGNGHSLDPSSLANMPSDRRIMWKQDPVTGGYVYENAPLTPEPESKNHLPNTPSEQMKANLEEFRAMCEIVDSIRGISHQEAPADPETSYGTVQMPLRIGDKEAVLNLPLKDFSSLAPILDFAAREREIESREREATERNQGINKLLEWVSSEGSPRQVFQRVMRNTGQQQTQGAPAASQQEAEETITCPECDTPFAIPAGATKFMCPTCSTYLGKVSRQDSESQPNQEEGQHDSSTGASFGDTDSRPESDDEDDFGTEDNFGPPTTIAGRYS